LNGGFWGILKDKPLWPRDSWNAKIPRNKKGSSLKGTGFYRLFKVYPSEIWGYKAKFELKRFTPGQGFLKICRAVRFSNKGCSPRLLGEHFWGVGNLGAKIKRAHTYLKFTIRRRFGTQRGYGGV